MAATETPGTPATPETTKPAQRPSLGERMEAAGWTPEDVGEGSNGEPRKEPDKTKAVPGKKAPAKPAKEAAPKPDKPKEEPTEPEPDAAAKKDEPESDTEKLGRLGLIKKLAAEEGLVFEDGKITTKQHAEFRLLKKEQREQLQRAEKEAIARVEAAQGELSERFKRVEAFEGALKSRDHQGLAKALGYENWDKLQEDVVAWNADPNYVRIRELEEFKQRQEAEAETAAQQRAQAQKEQERAHAETTYLGNLATTMKGSTDPLVQAMSEDPLFIRAVYRIQTENWDGHETVTPEQAIRMAAQGSRVTLGEELKALHARLDKAFGKKPEPEKPAAPAPKPKVAGGPKSTPSLPARNVGRQERMKNYAQRLEEASQRDAKSGVAF